MSVKFAEGIVTKRSEVYNFDPDQIKMLQSHRGRYAEVPQEKFDSLLEDIKKNGQIAPIVVRRLEDGTVEVVAGFTRLMVMRELKKENPDIRISAIVHPSMSDKEALAFNVSENVQRTTFNIADEIHIAARARIEYGMTAAEIADLLGTSGKSRSVTHAGNLLKASTLPHKVLDRIAAGTLNFHSALKLCKVENVDEALETLDNSKASQTAATNKIVRDAGGKVSRGLPDLRKMLKQYPASPLGKSLKDYFAGNESNLEELVAYLGDGSEVSETADSELVSV